MPVQTTYHWMNEDVAYLHVKNVYDIPGISNEWSGEETWRLEPINRNSYLVLSD